MMSQKKSKKWDTVKPMTRCEQYARDVLSGKEVAGLAIKKAAQRFLNDLKRDDIYFDVREANKYVNFTERYCCLWEDKWRGKPMIIMPWMAFVLQQAYGWIRVSDGKRRVRKVFVEIAKKNAKSTLAASVNIYHLFQDDRVNTPNIYVGANSEEQATLCVNITGKVIENSPALAELIDEEVVKIYRKKEKINSIEHVERDGFIKSMAKEPAKTDTAQSGVKHGINVSLTVVDEYAMADSDNFLNTMESAMAARDEPLSIIITTAGYKQNGPCFQKLRKIGLEILDGIIENDSYLPFIWELDEDDDIYDENVWKKANPNLGVSVSKEFIRNRLLEAKIEGGSKEVDVKTYSLNMWVDSPEVWVSSDTWKRNSHGMKLKELDGLTCYGGLEIVSGLDLNGMMLFFPSVKPDIHAVKPLFWMAKENVIQNKMKIDCSKWVDAGYIRTTPGNVIDNEDIYTWILEELSKYNMHSLAFNINLVNHEILQGLVRAGVTVNPISQGYRGVSEPSLAWEELLTAAKIETFNNPVLAWMNSNCMIIRKENDIKVQRSNGRVAGISAAIHALAQWKTIEAEGQSNDQVITSW